MALIVLFSACCTWMLGDIYNEWRYPKKKQEEINSNKMWICGGIAFVSSFAWLTAANALTFPAVVAAKTASILTANIGGSVWARIRGGNSDLSSNKLITGIFIAGGAFAYILLDPELKGK